MWIIMTKATIPKNSQDIELFLALASQIIVSLFTHLIKELFKRISNNPTATLILQFMYLVKGTNLPCTNPPQNSKTWWLGSNFLNPSRQSIRSIPNSGSSWIISSIMTSLKKRRVIASSPIQLSSLKLLSCSKCVLSSMMLRSTPKDSHNLDGIPSLWRSEEESMIRILSLLRKKSTLRFRIDWSNSKLFHCLLPILWMGYRKPLSIRRKTRRWRKITC